MANILEIYVYSLLKTIIYCGANSLWVLDYVRPYIKASQSFFNYQSCFNYPKSDDSLVTRYAICLFIKHLFVYHWLVRHVYERKMYPWVFLPLFPVVLIGYSIRTVSMENVAFSLGPWYCAFVILLFGWYKFWQLTANELASISLLSVMTYFFEEYIPGYQFTLDLFLIFSLVHLLISCFSDPKYALHPLFVFYFAYQTDYLHCLTSGAILKYVLGICSVTAYTFYRAYLDGSPLLRLNLVVMVGCLFYFMYGLANVEIICPDGSPPPMVFLDHTYHRMCKWFGLEPPKMFFSDLPGTTTTTASTLIVV